MKVLMDLVAIQSEGSRGRGIGRYSQELSQETLKLIPKNIEIVLNALYPEHKKSILDDYKSLISKENISEYTMLDISEKSFQEKSQYNKLNTLLLKKQFNKYKDTDMIHFHSIFEGLGGKADILHDFSDIYNLKKVITLYDLIPLIYKDIYLSDENVKKWYFNKLKLIYEADLLLAISDATREDAINILGISPSKVVNISGAIDEEKFYKMDAIEKDKNKNILKKYSITQPYIMYTGGIDFRKNIESSIKAFAKIETQNFNDYQYVIVCKISDIERNNFEKLLKKLNVKKDKVIFTGFVSDQELNFLYNASSLFIFPSIYEGFGLPVLEAMTCGKRVIGSNISSVPEIIGRDDCMFDPTDIEDITNRIDYILNNEHLKEELEEYFYKRSKQFSWNKSAKITVDAYSELKKQKGENIRKIKVAFFSPLPNKRSGISDYSLELLPFISKYFDLDIYVDDYEVENDYIINNFNIYSYKEFELRKEKYENIIYQFGNSQYHEYMYDIALNNPGIIVLHDFFLSGLVQFIANKRNDPQFFFDNLKYSHGKVGDEYFDKIMSHEIDVVETIKHLPINKRIIDSAKAILVHSSYAKGLFEKYYNNSENVYEIKQLIKTPSRKMIDTKNKNKKLLGFQSDDIVISAFGHITDTKQYDFILNLFEEESIFNNKSINLVFVGDFISDIYKNKINNLIKKYKFTRVKITGFVSDELYQEYLLASDIGINLRVDSRGETSRALLMNMAYALPTIINDYASFSELPDETTSKVELNSKTDFALKLNKLIENQQFREKMAVDAYEYICKEHNIDAIAEKYYDITFNHANISPKETNTIEDIATTLVNNALDTLLSEDEYHQVATVVKNNF
jgi:glycosyltransferase involved in cell wall biosynthesis